MAKTKIRTEIKRIDVYTIIFGNKIWDKEKLAEFSAKYVPVKTLEELSKYLAFSLMRKGTEEPFHEGFGNVMMYRNGDRIKHYSIIDGHPLIATDYTPGIAVHVLDEDIDYEYDTSIEFD